MASSELRICPHCGASVSGDTERCPNCDRLLADVAEQREDTSDVSPNNDLLTLIENDLAVSHEAAVDPDDATDNDESVGDHKAEDAHPILDASLLETSDPSVDRLPTVLDTHALDAPTPLGALIINPRPRPADETGEVQPQTPSIPMPAIDYSDDDDNDHDLADAPTLPPSLNPALPYGGQPSDTQSSGSKQPEQALDNDWEIWEHSDNPEATQPATHVNVSDTVQPAVRVPAPEPLPPLAPPVSPALSTTRSIEIPAAPFSPPPQATQQSAPVMLATSPYATTPAQVIPYSYQQPVYQPQPMMQQPSMGQPMGYGGWYSGGAPSDYWLQQRVKAYELAGYKIEGRNSHEALLTKGKNLSFLWWTVAGLTIFGALWYGLILLTSLFRKEKVYIGLEPDGYVFEEGPASAHIRRRRSRSGRRWGFAGVTVSILSTFLFILLVIAASVILNGYQAELNAAYPEITIFSPPDTPVEVNPSDVQDVKVIVLVMVVMFTIAVLGMVSGFIMAVISYIQAAAYRVEVVPLPGYD